MKEKKVIPFRKSLGVFILWGVLLTIVGYFSYIFVLKPYIVDKPTIIKVEKPTSESAQNAEDKK